jgi:CBS domain containing-hemolysin-like protein
MLTRLLAILGISLGTSFLCSILEAVLLSVTHGYVHVLKDQGSRAGEYLHRMQRRVDEPIAAILALNTIANTFGAALGGALALQLFGDAWMAAFSAGLTLTILLFSEILPKTLGATLWPRLAPVAAYTLRGMIFIMKPVVVPLTLYARLITPGGERPITVSRSELQALARIGRKEGALDEDEWRVVSSVMSLDEVPVGEVMTPRTDIVAVPIQASVEEAKAVMLDQGHLRLPVFEENLDRIVGILLARDLWRADRDGVTNIQAVMRPVQFAPAAKPVDDLIREMRTERVKMVIVLDEFGGTSGLVTLEDLLEEIVGEIQDEHEADEPLDFQTMENGDVQIWGGVSLREVGETLGLDLPDDIYDTLGGLIFSRLNRIPRVGDVVEVEGGTFKVQKMKGRRTEFLLFTPGDGPSLP